MKAWWGLCLLLASGTPAGAEWLEASSAHFVIYADDRESDITAFSNQLERYNAALADVTQVHLPPPSPSNRVTVFVVSSEAAVRRLLHDDNRYAAGFYVPRAGSSLAIIPRLNAASTHEDLEFPMITLLHEYAHHFLMSASDFALPRWENEGAAEFFSSAQFDGKGGISIGRPAVHRAAELFLAKNVPAEQLLDPDLYKPGKGYDAYYGKAWLLYHYLTFAPERRSQLVNYNRLLVEGKPQREAALQAFGDLKTLERDLQHYLTRPRILSLVIPASNLAIGPVTVRKLSPGEAAMMPLRVRSRRGVDAAQAAELLPEVRQIAGRYPHDAAVLSELAEAEHDAGNDKESIAAADAALAIDPAQVNAYVQKGLSLFRLAASDPDRATAYRRARAPFVALNRREHDHPLPLIYYYRSFVDQGQAPPPLAVQGLERAVELAPFDLPLRMTLGIQEARLGKKAEALRALGPVAYNPHGGGIATAARKVIARLEADPRWDGRAGLAEMTASADDDGAEGAGTGAK